MTAISNPIAHLPAIHFSGRFAERRPVPYHQHAVCELVLVTEGACRVSLESGAAVGGGRGTLMVLPGQVPHNQVNDGFCRTTYVGFEAPRLAFSDRPRAVALGERDPASRWLEETCSLWTSRDRGIEGALSALLLAVLERTKAIEERDVGSRSLPRGVVEATRWLERNLVEPVSVVDLARLVSLSASHLTALFRMHLGCPPLRYQQRLRIALARKLLRNSYLSVAEVGAACGYADPNYFIRVFRAATGLTPSRWRRDPAAPAPAGP